MGDEGPVSIHPLFHPSGKDFDLHPELFRKKRMEKEVVIPFKILDSDAFVIQTLKFIEDGKVFGKGRRASRSGRILEIRRRIRIDRPGSPNGPFALFSESKNLRKHLHLSRSRPVKWASEIKIQSFWERANTRPHLPTPQ